ncbi:hypothetical protein [Novosphingobium sp.]|uniref:hypothetical protein n=1 Tax=Novosphingobium sp. TaxID=1874826 RepID=UPI000BD89C8F|nr:hypothetical protein [Novosphingobium sp.]OYW46768.1 MAG: hypothetical protein B7Z36_04285 [Novosphingobium sp. 12-63-9]
MAKTFKLPKKINAFKVPKSARKQANKLISRLQGQELEGLLGAVVAAVIAHLALRGKAGGEPLSRKLAGTVGSHLKH